MSRFIFMSERKLLMIILAACFLSIFLAANASAGKILFTSDRDRNNDIHVTNGDGSGISQLTNGAGDNWDPAWSPGGSKIVFTSERDGNLEIYVMNADGSGQTILTKLSRTSGTPPGLLTD